MWPFDSLFGKSDGPTTQELSTGGWEVVAGSLSDEDLEEELTQKQLENVARKCSLVYACVKKIAQSAAEPPLQAGRREDGNFETVDDFWAVELLKDPNDYYDYRTLINYVVSRQLLTGRSVMWKWRNVRGNAISELWPIPTQWVGIKTGSGSELIQHYNIKQGSGKAKKVQPEDIVDCYYPDPSSTFKALGPLQAASQDYRLDNERGNYVSEMMDNLVVPGLGIMTGKSGMSSKAKENLRSSLEDKAGKGKRGGTIFLQGDNVDAKMFNPLADLDLPGLINMTEARICMAFGMPPELVGARTGLEHSTYSNKSEARESFYKETMVPLWKGLQSSLTRGLIEEEVIELRFDLSKIAELQTNQQELSERASNLYKSGLASRNEARNMVGLPEVENDVRLVPATVIEEPVEGE